MKKDIIIIIIMLSSRGHVTQVWLDTCRNRHN